MDTSFVYGLVAGCLSGVVGKYYFQKFITGKQYVEGNGNKSKLFQWEQICADFPEFIIQLRADINKPEHKNIKEFFVVDQQAILNSPISRLRYDLTEVSLSAVNKLEELGYIEKIKNNCLLYVMRDDFITLLRGVDNVQL